VGRLRAVVAGEYDERIVLDARLLDGIKDLPGAVIHFGQAIGPIAVAGSAREL
jgi:hypothetical protein